MYVFLCCCVFQSKCSTAFIGNNNETVIEYRPKPNRVLSERVVYMPGVCSHQCVVYVPFKRTLLHCTHNRLRRAVCTSVGLYNCSMRYASSCRPTFRNV